MENFRTVETKKNPGCLIQLLWFAFIGWWLGQAWMIIAWIMMVTIIGIPIGVMMLNKLPWIIALRTEPVQVKISKRADGRLVEQEVYPRQINFILRAFYFILVGWWLSAVWMEAAYALCMSVIGLPLGFWMFDQVPAVVSLKR